MDWAGNISTFSPELLGLKNPDYGNFLLGNIHRDALIDLPQRPNFERMLRDIGAGVEMCRELAENGTFASAETAYCHLTRMRATDLVLDALERAQPNKSDQSGSGGPRVELSSQAIYGAPAYVDDYRRFGEIG